MNSEINKTLAAVRRALQDSVSVTADPPVISVAPGTPAITAVVQQAACGSTDKHGNEPYEPKMKDVEDTFDHLDMYLKKMADLLLGWYGFDEDKAVDIVFSAIDDLVKSKVLTPLPEDDATSETLLIWVEKAKKAGLGSKVQELAFKRSNG